MTGFMFIPTFTLNTEATKACAINGFGFAVLKKLIPSKIIIRRIFSKYVSEEIVNRSEDKI